MSQENKEQRFSIPQLPNIVKSTLLRWLVRKPEEEVEELVDPAEWYEEMLRAGGVEVIITKTALVKLRFARSDQSSQHTSQDDTDYRIEIGEILVQNVDENGNEREGEDPYVFGNPKLSIDERRQVFFQTHQQAPRRVGFWVKKENLPVKGIQVSEDRRIAVPWSDKGSIVKQGGYLVKKDEGDFYPIQPESLWGYEVTQSLQDEKSKRPAV